jgi:tetratricopeptide (TPR) repeat protein
LALLMAIQPLTLAVDKQQRKIKEAEAKRLTALGRTAEKQGHLLDARQQYLASEHVLFTSDAQKGLERVAEAADGQVKALMTDAAQAYAAENFTKAAQLLESAGALHPGNLTIGCDLALTRYQQGNRDEALSRLDQCIGAMRDPEPRRQLAELYTALVTGDRTSVAAPGIKPQVSRLNDAILITREMSRRFAWRMICSASRTPASRDSLRISKNSTPIAVSWAKYGNSARHIGCSALTLDNETRSI